MSSDWTKSWGPSDRKVAIRASRVGESNADSRFLSEGGASQGRFQGAVGFNGNAAAVQDPDSPSLEPDC